MSNLTTTQPGAFDALLALLQATAAAQSPPVAVLDTEVIQYQPGSYVQLTDIEQHQFDVAALGSFAFYEEYELCGCTTTVQGLAAPGDIKTVRDATFTLHETVVQATVVANRGANGTPVLGSSAPTALEWIIPSFQHYSAGPADMGGGGSGIAGVIDWRFRVHARITVP